MGRKYEFDIKTFAKKLTSDEPLYLSRAEKEYVATLMEDNQDYERILEIFDNREYRKKYLKEERAKRKGLLYPDADEIYRKYFEQKEFIEDLKTKCLEKDGIILDLHKKILNILDKN